jgi:hypothetical protein
MKSRPFPPACGFKFAVFGGHSDANVGHRVHVDDTRALGSIRPVSSTPAPQIILSSINFFHFICFSSPYPYLVFLFNPISSSTAILLSRSLIYLPASSSLRIVPSFFSFFYFKFINTALYSFVQ